MTNKEIAEKILGIWIDPIASEHGMDFYLEKALDEAEQRGIDATPDPDEMYQRGVDQGIKIGMEQAAQIIKDNVDFISHNKNLTHEELVRIGESKYLYIMIRSANESN